MRFPVFVFFALCLLPAACMSGSARDYRPRSTEVLSQANFTNYEIGLEPWEFRIIAVSNHTEPLLDNSGDWWKDAVIYQVYVRSFYDSDGNGTGDLRGLTEKLDYITNLGVDGIWTMPIFDSLHDGSIGRALGYEARNYYKIDPDYGDFDDWTNYAANAHSRGIKVIMDMVINHTSKDNPWFIASETNDPVYKDWYVWTNGVTMDELEKGGWKQPWGGGHAWDEWHPDTKHGGMFYATWGAELNFFNPAVRQEGKRIAGFWLTNGADGFRLDAIRYLLEDGPGALQADSPSTLAYIREYMAGIKSAKTNAFTVGEIWSSDGDVAKYYQDGKGLDCGFSFRYQNEAAEAIASEKATGINNYIHDRSRLTNIPKLFYAPFGDNHDMKRSMTKWRDNWDKAKLSAALLLTQPGTPFIYYGSEIGMLGQQTPMQWDAEKNAGFTTNAKPWTALAPYADKRNVSDQLADPDSLLNLYRKLIAFRKAEPAMRRGDIRYVRSGNRAVFSYLRTGTNVSYLIVGNVSGSEVTADLDFTGTKVDPAQNHAMTLIPFTKANVEE
jgi:glycosidase